MSKRKIDGLKIEEVADGVLLVKQTTPPFYFSCSDGLIVLPKEGRNDKLIVLDLNIEPKFVDALVKLFGNISHYINSHGHMDHIAHVHAWEQQGAQILAPQAEAKNLLELKNFYNCYEFEEGVKFSSIQQFGQINGYIPCEHVSHFIPGEILKLGNLEVKTIALTGHSISHVGFLLQKEKILHISCLGFDISSPERDGFGPWYGFKQCSIDRYKRDIEIVEKIYRKNVEFLTSSHGYIVRKPEMTPFNYMTKKFRENEAKIRYGLESQDPEFKLEEKIDKLLKKDLFFPKKKMEGFLKEIYTFWEYWIIKNHLLHLNR
ncbi:MAG: hypothetical protein BAJALOKI3v1_780014 [Promethearchaeota archaeon]|nr:MAG: hypothetical protein BAJALOKI3v1_780014 [Candidatus Lokiarchaeota archaeon]